jgi:polyphosphate kinase
MDQPDLRSAEHYINRELSLLEFNERVLAQALDRRIPLLERLKFLCISSNNLDEFFEIRVAGLKQRLELGSNQPGADGLSITEQLQAIHDRTRSLVDAQYACLNEVLLPALRHQGIELLARATWDTDTAQWLERYFEREVEPVLSPLGLDPARPFPRIQNKSLNFIVRLAGQDAFGRDTGLAIVQECRHRRVEFIGGGEKLAARMKRHVARPAPRMQLHKRRIIRRKRRLRRIQSIRPDLVQRQIRRKHEPVIRRKRHLMRKRTRLSWQHDARSGVLNQEWRPAQPAICADRE